MKQLAYCFYNGHYGVDINKAKDLHFIDFIFRHFADGRVSCECIIYSAVIDDDEDGRCGVAFRQRQPHQQQVQKSPCQRAAV